MRRARDMYDGFLPDMTPQHHLPAGDQFEHEETDECLCLPELVQLYGWAWYEHQMVQRESIPDTVPADW